MKIVDFRQKYGCYRTQFVEIACEIRKITVPLQRQKSERRQQKTSEKGYLSLSSDPQDNINKVGRLTHRLSKEKKG